MRDLCAWGWDDAWERSFPAHLEMEPARVIAVLRDECLVATPTGETEAVLSGRLLFSADSPSDLPAVGDWVLLRHGVIDGILPRRTLIRRKAPGSGQVEQVLAANVDVLFIVSGLDHDLNVRRLERYLVVAIESGARPVFVLNKADLNPNSAELVAEVRRIAAGHEVLLASALAGGGVAEIRERLPAGATGALIGSSGVGKSTIMNALLESNTQEVNEVRSGDSKGRHTTTNRHLFRLPQGGLLIDQPGLREIQLWATNESIGEAFPEIVRLAAECRFGDCGHNGEPGCAVTAAIASGELDGSRLQSFRKLGREAAHVHRESNVFEAGKRKQAIKRINRAMRKYYRDL
jgi:ribosome biogenesis GTPase